MIQLIASPHKMISLDQTGTSLPPSNEDSRLIVHVINF